MGPWKDQRMDQVQGLGQGLDLMGPWKDQQMDQVLGLDQLQKDQPLDQLQMGLSRDQLQKGQRKVLVHFLDWLVLQMVLLFRHLLLLMTLRNLLVQIDLLLHPFRSQIFQGLRMS